MDGIETLVCQRITFDLHSQIKQVKKAFIYLRNSLDGIPAREDEGIHSLMNPDTKQNADNAHSKKGVERNAQPPNQSGACQPFKNGTHFYAPFYYILR
ncbi:hypothetical protein AI2705V1_4741 (plasmid) [Enterobacter cloacae]|nr:hypothetical protein AI2705V1_4741 [Enterobacter cloacae]CAH3763913.1 hypothetical protein AI2705V1_4741 [Enterobacter cloacae]